MNLRFSAVAGALLLAPGCGVDAQAEAPPIAPAPPVEAAVATTPAAAEPDATEPAATEPAAAEPAPPADPNRTYRVAKREVSVLTAPRRGASVRGVIHANKPFEVLGAVDGKDCAAGWAELPTHGYLCLDHTEPTDLAPKAQPELVRYDPPEPEEFEQYMATGEYDHSEPIEIVPAYYAKRWRRFKGQLYRDLASWNAGNAPIGALLGGAGNKYHFNEIVETERGPVLVREDGQVAALNDVYVYPISRLQGHNFEVEPVASGLMPAFAIDYDNTAVHVAPDDTAEVHHRIQYHEKFMIKSEPVAKGSRWYEVPDALGPGKPGYVNDLVGVRHPMPPPQRPSGVGDDELWIDVELDQQVLQLVKGDEVVWFTLVSTGEAPMGTPKGIYTITDKMATKTMRSRPDAADPYMVEDVPWTIHFKPAYAIHAAYWHWGFGKTASHGCINMAPRDVKYLWERIGPVIPDGWHTSWTTADAPGTVLQVRRLDLPAPDFRQQVARD